MSFIFRKNFLYKAFLKKSFIFCEFRKNSLSNKLNKQQKETCTKKRAQRNVLIVPFFGQ